ncbi:MAG: DNA-processing protein DprA [Thermodesulfovibrionales bacterium]|nr:DNA-processing protein DprA [Thermodesulfovibrionales bacterium]
MINASTDVSELRFWIALNFIRDIGPISIKRLLAVFHSPKRIFNATISELSEVFNIKNFQAKNITQFNEWDKVDKELQKIRDYNVKVITLNDDEYPESLKLLDSSPVLLYTMGKLLTKDKYSIAIVGSRKMTEYGRKVATQISSELASSGFTIVSGLATGIDATSHKGALMVGGRSIAVLGSGVDRPYPYQNIGLYKDLIEKGCVLSEFPMGTPPYKENFPRRNRIISGLSLGVVIVEATRDSGSLITAKYAIEQNKEVFAIPGNIFSVNSQGTNELIKKGAKLVQRIEDILEELRHHLKGSELYNLRPSSQKLEDSVSKIELDEDEKRVLNILNSNPVHIDTISRELRLAPNKLSAILLNLEIKGLIRQTEGKKFCII